MLPTDLTGKRVQDINVIQRVDNDKHGRAVWLCECRKCEAQFLARAEMLVKVQHPHKCPTHMTSKAARQQMRAIGKPTFSAFTTIPVGVDDAKGYRKKYNNEKEYK